MATESAINGTYGAQQASNLTSQLIGSHASNHTTNGINGATGTHAPNTPSGNAEGTGVSKDEVGWYFVEQYYTTMSRSPDKLHLFYSKRSQFVSGVETEKVSVSVGQRAINERIKELDIQDCRVRVSNVDSQESFKNIVVQVIGEMSNKLAPHRKFVQTFILAEQPNGYFVLNDIFRYIADDEDDVEQEMPAELEAQEPVSSEQTQAILTGHAVTREIDAHVVDHKLASVVVELTAVLSDTDVDISKKTETSAVDADASNEEGDDEQDTPDESPENNEVDAHEPEAPKVPVPTPTVTVKPAKVVLPVSTQAVPAKPAAPKTWASIANRANNALPAAAAVTISPTPLLPTQTKTIHPAPTSSVGSSTTTNENTPPAPQPMDSEWQTAGQDHTKKQSRQVAGSTSNGGGDKGNVLGYVKNVTEKVDASLLRTTLSHFGKLAYFDISRPKNCAFVEFSDTTGYNAAVAANPHNVGGEQIFVEERRPRSTAYGGNFNSRGGMRVGRGHAENRTPSQGRGGAGFVKDGGRGGFVPRGGRGGLAPRGRGTPQPV